GGGREELVRVSAPAVALESLQHALAATRIHFRKPGRGFGFTTQPTQPEPMVRDLGASRRSERALAGVVDEYRGWRFSFHEREGLLPMADALAAAADATAPLVRASRARTRRVNARYVNASLWAPGPEGRERVPAEHDRLAVGRGYELGLQIGARDRLIPVYEASPFREIPRVPGQAGVWLEVAVNGIGFDVEGSAVQDLWLPYGEPSDQLWFAVRPTRAGVAVLRYTLYHRQNVVQSYRLAAHTGHPDDEDSGAPDPQTGQRLLAEALHADPKKMPRRATYVTRLEYEAAPVAEAARLPERRLSIVANQVGSERVVTVKGRGFFLENDPGADRSLNELARNELFEVSVNKLSPARMDWLSRFGSNRAFNAAQLRAVLPRLALAGWRIYQSMFDARLRDEMRPVLAGTDAQICVAHAMLTEVVPWALMYDRPYTAKPVPGGRLEVCTAALPAADGSLAVHECGQSPHCVLHQGLAEKNVACPLRFWGFRHQIEVPPRQTEGAPAPVPAAPAATAAGAPRLAAVINVALATAAAHEQQLRTLQLSGPRGVVWQQIETRPDRLVEALDDADLDLVYLYCHARGGLGDPEKTMPPKLEFGDAAGTSQYAADEFVMRWRRQPLVILNGCSTAAFSPDALSPFVKTFTRDCGAGGVVGTEIPVHEDLAREFAARLIRRVLEGEPAGRALLAVRRELLAGDNPLGLAYTLYAFSEMKIGG
ncbi:MAG: CHAT domain-containing protein, partial [Rubrivivax sp.]|nr:CHAT domain-containing protein [Rubrivivax sp.]